MPFKPEINIKLVKCKTCGKKYNNPLSHTCVIKLGTVNRAAARTAAKRRAAAKKKTGKKK